MAELIRIDGDDAELNSAMEEARRRIPEFRKALEDDWQRIIPVLDRPLVKARFQSESTGAIEHIWIDVTNFDDDKIVGELANEPGAIPELSQGDEVRISAWELTDWLYRDGSKMVGGFTLAVLEKRQHE